MIRSFVDSQQRTHTLDLDAVLVDGVRCVSVSVQATAQAVQFTLETQNLVTCDLGQFWQEVAGPDLSAQEAGLLLADCLMRQVILQRTSSVLQEAICQLTRAAALSAEISSFAWLTARLDPLARQVMSAYDGTPGVTEMLARILHREPATIQRWARQLGLETPAPAPEIQEVSAMQDLLVDTEPLPVLATQAEAKTEAEAESHERFCWSPARMQQLEQALVTCTGTTVVERARQIAETHHWPVQAVRSKLYELQRPRRDRSAAARESEHPEPAKEEDQHADLREAISV